MLREWVFLKYIIYSEAGEIVLTMKISTKLTKLSCPITLQSPGASQAYMCTFILVLCHFREDWSVKYEYNAHSQKIATSKSISQPEVVWILAKRLGQKSLLSAGQQIGIENVTKKMDRNPPITLFHETTTKTIAIDNSEKRKQLVEF